MASPFRFSIFTTDSTDPDTALDVTNWFPDPISGEYDEFFETEGRGSHVVTLGGPPGVAKGRKHQDSGLFLLDRKIRIAGSDFTKVLRDEIQTKYEAVDTEFHFTDGEGEVFRVRFLRRPRGYHAVLNTPLFAIGILTSNPPASEKYRRYSYDIKMFVVAQPV